MITIFKAKTIKIKNDTFQVLKIIDEIDKVDVRNNKLVGEHTLIELHKEGSKLLHPTHALKIYNNDQENGFLYELVRKGNETRLNGLKKIVSIQYKNKKKIKVKDIKIFN